MPPRRGNRDPILCRRLGRLPVNHSRRTNRLGPPKELGQYDFLAAKQTNHRETRHRPNQASENTTGSRRLVHFDTTGVVGTHSVAAALARGKRMRTK